MKRICIIFFLPFFSLLNTIAQESNYYFNLEASGGYISPGKIPFWLRSNQFGSIPVDNAFLSIAGSATKEYDKGKSGFFDWGGAVNVRGNIGQKSNFNIIEGYGKLRMGIFEIRAGRSQEIIGLCDTSLTSGSWAVSGNALGIPNVQISIPEFYTLPILSNLFAFKGSFVHGWFGKIPLIRYGEIRNIGTYMHQKSLYGRFGKAEWRWKLYGGFNHQVLWGNEKEYWGDRYDLSPFKTYLYVVSGTGWSGSRMGASLGSIDIGLEYEFKNVKIFAYRQNLYDAGALYYLANIADGLNGLSLENRQVTHSWFHWKKILVEVLYTKNQAGESWSKPTPSGDEDYYNHYIYTQGWSYQGNGIGNPLVTPRDYAREGFPSDPSQYFINNRVIAFHVGYEGSVQKWDIIIKASYSMNYGTYRTVDLFPEVRQLSTFLEANRELRNGLKLGFISAFDAGDLLYDSFGCFLKVSKSF